jgi:hypothetical protein
MLRDYVAYVETNHFSPRCYQPPFGKPQGLPKGWFDSTSLTEDWCEGSKVQSLVISLPDNNPAVTLGRHLVRAARPLNAPVEAGRWAQP